MACSGRAAQVLDYFDCSEVASDETAHGSAMLQVQVGQPPIAQMQTVKEITDVAVSYCPATTTETAPTEAATTQALVGTEAFTDEPAAEMTGQRLSTAKPSTPSKAEESFKGANAPLTAGGFTSVTSMFCPSEMETFFVRVLSSMGLDVWYKYSKPYAQGMMHWFTRMPDVGYQYCFGVYILVLLWAIRITVDYQHHCGARHGLSVLLWLLKLSGADIIAVVLLPTRALKLSYGGSLCWNDSSSLKLQVPGCLLPHRG
jgi:hypothetical protein